MGNLYPVRLLACTTIAFARSLPCVQGVHAKGLKPTITIHTPGVSIESASGNWKPVRTLPDGSVEWSPGGKAPKCDPGFCSVKMYPLAERERFPTDLERSPSEARPLIPGGAGYAPVLQLNPGEAFRKPASN